MGMTQHRDPGVSFFSSLPRANNPRLSLGISGPLWIPLQELRLSGCKWNFMHWPFKRLSQSLAISPRQTETLLLFTAECYLGSFLALVLKSGELSFGFRPHISQRELPGHWIIPPELQVPPWEPSRPSHMSSTLPTSPVVVKWFLLSVRGYKASVKLLFNWLFRMIVLYSVTVTPDWSWEDVSVASPAPLPSWIHLSFNDEFKWVLFIRVLAHSIHTHWIALQYHSTTHTLFAPNTTEHT